MVIKLITTSVAKAIENIIPGKSKKKPSISSDSASTTSKGTFSEYNNQEKPSIHIINVQIDIQITSDDIFVVLIIPEKNDIISKNSNVIVIITNISINLIEANLTKWLDCPEVIMIVIISNIVQIVQKNNESLIKKLDIKEQPNVASMNKGQANINPTALIDTMLIIELINIHLLNNLSPSRIAFNVPNITVLEGDCLCCVTAKIDLSREEETPEVINKTITLNL